MTDKANTTEPRPRKFRKRDLIGYCAKCGKSVEVDFCENCGQYVQPSPHDTPPTPEPVAQRIAAVRDWFRNPPASHTCSCGDWHTRDYNREMELRLDAALQDVQRIAGEMRAEAQERMDCENTAPDEYAYLMLYAAQLAAPEAAFIPTKEFVERLKEEGKPYRSNRPPEAKEPPPKERP